MAANPNPGTNVWGTISGPNKFGAPPNNANRQAINFDNAISTQDYTGRHAGTPNAANDITSPLALASTAQVLVIPPNATRVTLIGSAAFSMSEFGTAAVALTQYVTVPANTPISIDVARQNFLYVQGTGNLSFYFSTM
jgi:hypothetical protein